jgi:hypothetical protein
MPSPDRILCGARKKSMAGLDLCLRDGAIGLYFDHKNDFSANVHTLGELGIDRSNTRDYSAVNVACDGCAYAEGKATKKENRARCAE